MMRKIKQTLGGFLLVLTTASADEPKPSLTLHAISDFMALHVEGKAPAGAATVQYRLATTGGVENLEWLDAKAAPGQDGGFKFDVRLPGSRWSELQVRATKDGSVLAMRETRHKPETFTMLAPERIATLPVTERAAWTAYMRRSADQADKEYETLAAECRHLGLARSTPAPGNRAELELDSDTPESWFSGEEARLLADAAISYQTPGGGWSKAVDYNAGPRKPGTHWTSQDGDGWHYCGTFDNRSTTEQIKLLAGVFSATKREDARAAVLRGLEYVFSAQFPNGGWPQNYPVESGYHEAITLNDNAMVHVLELLLTIAERKPPFTVADEALQQRARAAFEKGIACLAAMQVKVDDRPSVWCAQHDPLTLAPVHARTKEPPSLSGGESAELVRFLMRKAPITPETTVMIETALVWFEAHRLTGLRNMKNSEGKTDYTEDTTSQEVYWARFYDLATGKAIFPGSQDGINYPTYHEMAAKNKVAYDFMTAKPAELVGKEAARWKKRVEKENKAR